MDDHLVNKKHVFQRLGVEKSGSEFKVLQAPKALNLRGLREGVELGGLAGLAAWRIFQQVGGTTWTLKTDSGSTPNSDLVGFVFDLVLSALRMHRPLKTTVTSPTDLKQ